MEYLLKIHKHLFSDIYDFAGKMRTVNLAKGKSVFCYVENLELAQEKIFRWLKENEYLHGLSKEEFIGKLAFFAGELNALHPFREGNGRCIRVFLKLLANNAGFELNYEDADIQELLKADIAAFYGDLVPMENILDKIIHHIM